MPVVSVEVPCQVLCIACSSRLHHLKCGQALLAAIVALRSLSGTWQIIPLCVLQQHQGDGVLWDLWHVIASKSYITSDAGVRLSTTTVKVARRCSICLAAAPVVSIVHVA